MKRVTKVLSALLLCGCFWWGVLFPNLCLGERAAAVSVTQETKEQPIRFFFLERLEKLTEKQN